MLKYFPSGDETLTPEYCIELQIETKNVISSNPGERIWRHMEALKNSRLKSDNSTVGKWFELCGYESDVDYGIDPKRILFGRKQTMAYTGLSLAEVDQIILPTRVDGLPYCFYYKTSIRERGKQADRDANIISRFEPLKNAVHVIVMDLEYDWHTMEQTNKTVVSKKKGCYNIHQVISVRQEAEFTKLLDVIKRQ